MKLNKIDIACSKYFNQFFWVSLILVGFHEFGQPIFSAAEKASSPSVTKAPYVRKLRDTHGLSPTSSPENSDGQEQYGSPSSSRSGFYPYPSFKHKYQTRMTRFHGEAPSSSYSGRSLTTFPKLNPLAGLLSGKSGEALPSGRKPTIEDLFRGENQDPTFTPYISARALSNIPQFFQHLRDNLEALQLDDDDDESDSSNSKILGQSGDGMFLYGNDDEGRPINIPHPPENRNMRWMPMTAGMTGRAHVRHFVNDPAEPDLFYRKPALYNPSRNAYEFGLG
ncbi:unnamed protein product [Orchesella dallaii]|uniref:Uncharacterized protein n=1 Tax=Orchesella dallaii TaxID=48710 RepID=A0ABP1Q893_9HEXA